MEAWMVVIILRIVENTGEFCGVLYISSQSTIYLFIYLCYFSNWARFDDQEVTQINARDVITPAAYILFYCNNSP